MKNYYLYATCSEKIYPFDMTCLLVLELVYRKIPNFEQTSLLQHIQIKMEMNVNVLLVLFLILNIYLSLYFYRNYYLKEV